jgi:predicted MFS family arabinose efflux permease
MQRCVDKENSSPWLLVFSSVSLMAVLAGLWYCGSVLLLPLVDEFGPDYAATVLVFSLFTMSYGGSALLIGHLVDHLGPVRIIASGGVIIVLSTLTSSIATARWHLYISHGVLAALGVAGVGYVPIAVLLTRHFNSHRGLALGIASSGAGLGILGLVPLTHAASEAYGWRVAFLVLGGTSALIVSAALILIKVYGTSRTPSKTMEQESRQSKTAVALAVFKSPLFWLVLIAILLTNCPIQMLMTYHIAHLVEAGQKTEFIGPMLTILGIMSIPGKVLWGYLSDAFRLELAYSLGAICFIGAIGVLLCFHPSVSGTWMIYAYAVMMGVGYSIGPAMTSILCGRFFAGPYFGTIFGVMNAIYNISAGLAVWLGGLLRDASGNYRLAFVAAGASVLIGAASTWLGVPLERAMSPRNRGKGNV